MSVCIHVVRFQMIRTWDFVPALNSMSMISTSPPAETFTGNASSARGAGPSSTLPAAS